MARNDDARDKVLARLRARLDRLEALLAVGTSAQTASGRPDAIAHTSALDAHHPVPRARRLRQRQRASA